jgi:hypothetical protein
MKQRKYRCIVEVRLKRATLFHRTMKWNTTGSRKKKKLKKLHTPGKEKENKIGRKSLKEVEKKSRRPKQSVIDVEALINAGSNNSNTNKTVALMTTEEAETSTTTADQSILQQAKKGLRVQAFKVH